jgi:rubrerythrin
MDTKAASALFAVLFVLVALLFWLVLAADNEHDHPAMEKQLAHVVETSRTIGTGPGLSGGGDLSENRNLQLNLDEAALVFDDAGRLTVRTDRFASHDHFHGASGAEESATAHASRQDVERRFKEVDAALAALSEAKPASSAPVEAQADLLANLSNKADRSELEQIAERVREMAKEEKEAASSTASHLKGLEQRLGALETSKADVASLAAVESSLADQTKAAAEQRLALQVEIERKAAQADVDAALQGVEQAVATKADEDALQQALAALRTALDAKAERRQLTAAIDRLERRTVKAGAGLSGGGAFSDDLEFGVVLDINSLTLSEAGAIGLADDAVEAQHIRPGAVPVDRLAAQGASAGSVLVADGNGGVAWGAGGAPVRIIHAHSGRHPLTADDEIIFVKRAGDGRLVLPSAATYPPGRILRLSAVNHTWVEVAPGSGDLIHYAWSGRTKAQPRIAIGELMFGSRKESSWLVSDGENWYEILEQ